MALSSTWDKLQVVPQSIQQFLQELTKVWNTIVTKRTRKTNNLNLLPFQFNLRIITWRKIRSIIRAIRVRPWIIKIRTQIQILTKDISRIRVIRDNRILININNISNPIATLRILMVIDICRALNLNIFTNENTVLYLPFLLF